MPRSSGTGGDDRAPPTRPRSWRPRPDDGFAIAPPYGARANWLKNVLAEGSATIVHEGTEHRVVEPQVVPMAQAAPYFPQKERRSHRLFAVDTSLLVRRVT